jgi:hypothetical protein
MAHKSNPEARFVVRSSIPARQLSEHARLEDDVDDLLFELRMRRREKVISGLLLVSARRLLADTFRLVSREPDARALLRLPPGPEVDTPTLENALRDVRMALARFQNNHSDQDSEHEEGWLIDEARHRTY